MTCALLEAAGVAPCVPVETLSRGGDVLVLAPHADDETLGCGAAIAALSASGRRAQVVVVTDGAASHPGSRSVSPADLRRMRADEVKRAVEILTDGQGLEPVLLGYPDTDAPDSDAALARIVQHLSATTSAVWSTWGGDPHVDHQRTALLALRLVAQFPSLALWSYPIWGRFVAGPQVFDRDALVLFDTRHWQERKASAIAAHASQMTGLIPDDPNGFRMTEAHQRHFLTNPEIFLREAPR